MTYQEYKTPFGITERVRYNMGPDTNTYTGIIVGVRFTFAALSFDIIDDKTSQLHEKIRLEWIEASLATKLFVDFRLPTLVEQENNLFTDRMGYGETIFDKPTSIMSPPHVSGVEEMINAPSKKNILLSDDQMQPDRVKQQFKPAKDL